MEETGTYQALTYLDNIGRVDVDRFMVLRGGSNYTMQPPGIGAAENLLKENDGYAGLAASLENIYIVGSIVMDELLDNWDQYSVAVPGSQNDSDANAQQLIEAVLTRRKEEAVNRVIFAVRGAAQLGLCVSRGYAAGAVLLVLFAVMPMTWAGSAGQRLESIKEQPLLLRQFLQRMPKGGDLHNHLSGAVYAESYLRWAAQDGKCIDSGGVITLPPCEPAGQSEAVREYLRASDAKRRYRVAGGRIIGEELSAPGSLGSRSVLCNL